jgi:hypothetical protein
MQTCVNVLSSFYIDADLCKYVGWVSVTETLRKHPVVPFLDRVPVSDYVLPNPSSKETEPATLREGTLVYIPVMGIHHDPKYYPEPERFDPERFTEENKNSRPHFTYLPFGDGPRMCIGKTRYIALALSPHGLFLCPSGLLNYTLIITNQSASVV